MAAIVVLSGCALGDINPFGPDQTVAVTAATITGTWTVSGGTGTVTFEPDGTFIATGLPSSAFNPHSTDVESASGTGTWMLSPGHPEESQVIDLVDLTFETITTSEAWGMDMPFDAVCDGSNVRLVDRNYDSVSLLKDGLPCTVK